MNTLHRARLLSKATGFVGAAAVAAFAALPAMAQVNPRPSVLNEPRYDGVPGNATSAPASSPSLNGVNPRPSIFNESRYDGIPSPDAVQVAPAATPSLSQVNPSPEVLNEPRYDGVPGVTSTPSSTYSTPSSSSTVAPSNQFSSLDREFMVMAAHSDQFEIQSSQLALERSNNSEVREYAQQMIQEHTLSSQQLAPIAAQRGVTLPTAPAPFDRAVLDQLAQLSGPEFDRAYLEAQANAHTKTATVYQTEIQHGDAQDVRVFAAQILPTVQEHQQMASSMVANYAQDTRRPVQ